MNKELAATIQQKYHGNSQLLLPAPFHIKEKREARIMENPTHEFCYKLLRQIEETEEQLIVNYLDENLERVGGRAIDKERLHRACYLPGEEEAGRLVYTGYPEEDAISYLQQTGWLQKHDREIMMSGREQLRAHRERFVEGGRVYSCCSNCGTRLSAVKSKFCSHCGYVLTEKAGG